MAVVINGVTYSGNNLVMSNNRIIIDGKDVTDSHKDAQEINVKVVGNITSLHVSSCKSFQMTGDAGNITTQSGDVNIEGNVKGSISTMSGDVDCYEVAGNISTMSGNVKHRK